MFSRIFPQNSSRHNVLILSLVDTCCVKGYNLYSLVDTGSILLENSGIASCAKTRNMGTKGSQIKVSSFHEVVAYKKCTYTYTVSQVVLREHFLYIEHLYNIYNVTCCLVLEIMVIYVRQIINKPFD